MKSLKNYKVKTWNMFYGKNQLILDTWYHIENKVKTNGIAMKKMN